MQFGKRNFEMETDRIFFYFISFEQLSEGLASSSNRQSLRAWKLRHSYSASYQLYLRSRNVDTYIRPHPHVLIVCLCCTDCATSQKFICFVIKGETIKKNFCYLKSLTTYVLIIKERYVLRQVFNYLIGLLFCRLYFNKHFLIMIIWILK